eukprot:GILK01001222.1.p1 GENE.GILK01001222.1~~GILK01001222.1.p1  ORF type:complete len:209 (-),score=26.65 GILK01001222.1:154-744(-)
MSKGTTCAKAIEKWEEKNQARAADAEVVKLLCQIPPIEKMDNSLNNLTNCRHLSLSTNCIEKMINLPGLRNLEILSLGRNNIKKIQGLEEVGQTLRELWISYNQIEKLDGLQPCVRLTTLFISNNKIKNWDEISKLALLPELNNVLLVNNPFCEGISKDDIKPRIVKRVPQLKTLDGEMITDIVRKRATEDEEAKE